MKTENILRRRKFHKILIAQESLFRKLRSKSCGKKGIGKVLDRKTNEGRGYDLKDCNRFEKI